MLHMAWIALQQKQRHNPERTNGLRMEMRLHLAESTPAELNRLPIRITAYLNILGSYGGQTPFVPVKL